MPRTPSKPSRIIIPPGATDPLAGGGMGGMGMGGMGGWVAWAWAAWAWAAWVAWAEWDRCKWEVGDAKDRDPKNRQTGEELATHATRSALAQTRHARRLPGFARRSRSAGRAASARRLQWLVRCETRRSNSEDDGFFGWHFHAPFDTSEVKTVAVFFKSNVFRRDLEKQLTEAVIKEITCERPTAWSAIMTKADSLLTGTITSDDKNLVVEAPPTCRAS